MVKKMKISEINPEILIISNKDDFSTDHIAFHLNKMNASYLRLNRDQFIDFKINLNPKIPVLYGNTKDFKFKITLDHLKCIYFRAPIFLRDNYHLNLSPDDQFSRDQWASFVRSLILFENILWVNHPQATYAAEIKPYQLFKANKIGFNIPNTLITNSNDNNEFSKENKVAVKTLEPMMLNIENKDAFIYTNIISSAELMNADISSGPVILQEALVPKVDLRVTVVGNKVFAVSIKKNDKGIDMDWRFEKGDIQYDEIKLPQEIEKMCVNLTKDLGLKYGAIDLVISDNKYYFIEINPTGDWLWLMNHLDLKIDKEIAKLLLNGN